MDLGGEGWKPEHIARFLSLVEAEKRYYQEIVAALPAPLAILTNRQVIQAANRAFRRTLGLELDQILDAPLERVLPVAGLAEAARELLSGSQDRATLSGEVDTPAGARRLRLTLIAFRGWSGDAEREIILLAEDVAHPGGLAGPDLEGAVLAERLAAQTARAGALKRLAATVVHECNNLLTILGGHGEELLSGLPAGSPLRAGVEEILEASRRLARLTGPLLACTRPPPVRREPFDLNAAIAGIAEQLQMRWNALFEVVVSLDPALGLVAGDREQIEDILLVLADFAQKAMPSGGSVRFSTARATVAAGNPETGGGLQPGDYAHAVVADTAPALDRETAARLFDPAVVSGSGHVLDVAYSVVKEGGGEMWVSQGPAGHNEVHLYLPLAPLAQAPEPVPAAAEPRAAGPRGPTVLVVEDEAGIRGLIRRILVREGYRVIEAADGEEAMEAAAHEGSIDLLLSDVVMPRLGGRELAERLRRLRPGLKVLYISGYSSDAAVQAFPEGAGFLQKPFTLESLMAKVREMMSGHPE
jgi:two-component system cell cycle sensor histidine kinase/response regulator CckA